ncbi:cadherin domain protein [Dictyocaulus viviparus]|uniref:Cadherin domain protein n=1 Tax=Dictyocaulus viviparus TaxID=29172 RepID=A0A0D8XYA5_DICVI|nr:cadherin domain protein [Dictyocaulus viviparus]
MNVDTEKIRIESAQDQGVPPRSTNMTLIIHVTDFNDNPPVFEKPFYEAEVVENCALMTTVLQVKSKDADSRENGKVFYRITNGSSAFGIDEKSGVVYTNENIDRETQNTYELTVTAQDQGKAFGIDEKSGMIYTNENIDRETQNTYELTVTAQDQGKPPLSSSVVIRVFVLDVNDNAPVCASGTMKMVVPRDSALSTTVGTVVVADPDNGINGTVVYRSQQSNALFFVKSNG